MSKMKDKIEDDRNLMKCERCGSTDSDVSYRDNNYAQEIGNDSTAYHTVCDECDSDNGMNI